MSHKFGVADLLSGKAGMVPKEFDYVPADKKIVGDAILYAGWGNWTPLGQIFRHWRTCLIVEKIGESLESLFSGRPTHFHPHQRGKCQVAFETMSGAF